MSLPPGLATQSAGLSAEGEHCGPFVRSQDGPVQASGGPARVGAHQATPPHASLLLGYASWREHLTLSPQPGFRGS
jgi:hypothetical protein